MIDIRTMMSTKALNKDISARKASTQLIVRKSLLKLKTHIKQAQEK